VTESPKTPRPDEAEDSGRPKVTDKRIFDRETGELRNPRPVADNVTDAVDESVDGNGAQPEEADPTTAQIEELKAQVADRTTDLQRVQAEYVNYKRRVDRDRDLARASGVESVLTELLPVLDSLQAAREHDELTGGFKGVAEEIERIAARHGLESYGEAGDPFDPRIHEALMNAQADGITVTTCVTVLQPGYKIKDRVIRPARVAVAEPDPSAVAGEGRSSEGSASDGSNPQQ
jgi:molecular chaperone GrpE